MKRIIILLSIIAASVQAQVTNTVNISNSLLGPVTNFFTGTVVQSTGDIVLTGAVFNVTNDFSSTVTVTNNFNVGTVSVTNDIVNTVTVTNIVENIAVAVTNTTIVYSPTEFVTQTHTSTPDSVRIYSGTNLATSVVAGANMDIYLAGGGGGGDVSINGVTTNSFSFVGQFPVSVTNIGGTFYFGQVGGGGTFIPAGDSNQVFNYIGTSTQTFTVPSGVTQLYAYAWGAGGGGGSTAGGAGGYSFGYFSVTNGEVLSVVIGEGGFVSSTTTATSVSTNTANPWPNGGWGASRHTARAGAGGGSTALLRGTNFLVVSGGGGGGTGSGAAGGAGGGTSGQDGFAAAGGIAGGGGTQSAGGTTGSTAIPLSITNSAGSFYSGGNGGLTTNLVASSAGGGGGGIYGAGGGLVTGTSGPSAGGGGGSGHINADQGVLGITVQAATPANTTNVNQPPPATDDPLYGSPTAQTWGRGGGTITAGSNGGMIIRWVQP